jgi:class 3 adenylate cyclase
VNTATLRSGTVIGSFEIEGEIGRGSLGIVYRGRHVHLDRPVALKVLHPEWTGSREFLERFREEGRVLARLEHPNIVRVYDAGQADGVFYLAMSHLDGWSLESLLGMAIPLEVALNLCRQIARALAYAHEQGVVHRDIKPANVMVAPGGQVTLMDLGMARLRDQPDTATAGARVGTPYYMAPEQILGQAVDGRADLYSLGVILYRMVTGRLPFTGPSAEAVYQAHLEGDPPPLDDACPAWLKGVLRRALARAPEDRFPDAAAMMAALTPPAATTLSRKDRTALSLDVVRSSRMKLPGLTMAIQTQFAGFRKYVREHLQAHQCLVHVWAGDGVLALFARPSQGAACAAAILDGLTHFNAAGQGKWEPIRVRLGVHSGPVLMQDGQPLGEVVSRTLDDAGHLQKYCPPDAVLISDATFQGVPVDGRWTSAPPKVAEEFPFPVFRYAGAGAATAVPVPERSAPPPARDPGLSLRLEVTTAGRSRELDVGTEALVGRVDLPGSRSPEIEIRGDAAVSRRHARIYAAEGGFFLEDLDSANGTRLNDQPVRPRSPVRLQPGDTVAVGEKTTLRVLSLEPGGIRHV